jgi:hypothetical protein
MKSRRLVIIEMETEDVSQASDAIYALERLLKVLAEENAKDVFVDDNSKRLAKSNETRLSEALDALIPLKKAIRV